MYVNLRGFYPHLSFLLTSLVPVKSLNNCRFGMSSSSSHLWFPPLLQWFRVVYFEEFKILFLFVKFSSILVPSFSPFLLFPFLYVFFFWLELRSVLVSWQFSVCPSNVFVVHEYDTTSGIKIRVRDKALRVSYWPHPFFRHSWVVDR